MATMTYPTTTHQATPQEKRMNSTFVMATGVVAGLVMTILMAAARSIGLTPYNFEMMLGSLFLGYTGPAVWLTGLALHLGLSALFALIYAVGFRKVHAASGWIGASFAVVHWMIAGLFLAALPSIHPLIPEHLAAPGAFALNWGMFSFFYLLMVHLVYGSIIGDTFARYAFRHPEAMGLRRA